MLHLHVIIVFAIIVQSSITNYGDARVLPEAETIGTITTKAPKDVVEMIYIGKNSKCSSGVSRGCSRS
ncbi:unnamed protein product [Gordionus sp. m RMFG-2023]